VTAASRPTAAPSTTTVSHSTLRNASLSGMQPVRIIASDASRAAFSMLITPNAASRTIATVISVATIALSVLWT